MARSGIHFDGGEGGVRRAVLAISLTGLFASLTGCPEKVPMYEDTTALENPPPKPPNCPKSQELANITMANGEIADVRIVQFFDTKFYIPKDLMQRHFVDKYDRNSGGFLPKTSLGWTAPDIHSVECPGILHIVEEDHRPIGFGFALSYLIDDGPLKNIDPESRMNNFGIRKPYGEGYREKLEWGNGGVAAAYISLSSKVNVTYRYLVDEKVTVMGGPVWDEYASQIMATKKWIVHRKSAEEFILWLQKPPAERDNERVFVMGGKD